MNFSEQTPVKNPQEFLVVILSGFGNGLRPLTNDYGDQPCPKGLLPIGNKTMLSYVLHWVEDSGLKDILLICPSSHRDSISHYINSDPSSSSLSALTIDIQTLEQSQDLAFGTVSVLAHFSSRIRGDFVILPCDFIPAKSLRLDTILDKFRIESSTDGAIATCLFYEHRVQEKEKSGTEDVWSAQSTPLPILYDTKTGTLLHIDTLDDQDDDDLKIRMGLLWQYPRAKLTTRFVDSHVYVCKHAVLDAIQEKKQQFDSIREEFIPWLCKMQTQKSRRDKYSHILNPITNVPTAYSLALRHSTSRRFPPKRRRGSVKSLEIPNTIELSHFTPKITEENREGPSLRIGLVLHTLDNGYASRANDTWSYLELNRAMLNDLPPALSYDQTLIDTKSNISTDSLIGDSTRVGERSTIKRSVIGRHCIIGKNVKLVGCILMEHCIVGDGVKLESCILGKNTHVSDRAELVRCITQAGFEVEANGVYKNEKLEVSDWTSGPAGSGDESEAGSENDGGDSDDSG